MTKIQAFEKIKKIFFKYYALLFFAGIFFLRLSLLGKGMMSFPDEVRYYFSQLALNSLFAGDYQKFLHYIFSTQARAGDAIIRLLPSAIQYLLEKYLGINQYSQVSLVIPTLFNLITSICLLWIFYKMTRILFKKNISIFISIVIYSFLVNSNIYLRHILPYDVSLFFMLTALYIVVAQKLSVKRCVISGLIFGFGFLIYPGYFMFFLIILASLIFQIKHNNLLNRKSIILIASYFLGVAFPLMIIEIISRVISMSYLSKSFNLTGTVKQGSYKEVFTFLIKYLYFVEGVMGLFLISSIVVYLYFLFRKVIGKKWSAIYKKYINVLVFSSVLSYFLYGIWAYLNRSVYYGRLIHMYMPFIVWIGVNIISHIKSKNKKLYFLSILIMSFASYLFFLFSYLHLDYPRDVLYRFRIDTSIVENDFIISESPLWRNELSPEPLYQSGNFPYSRDKNFTLVNFGYFYDFENNYSQYIPQNNEKLIFSKKHFLTYPAYMFEGFSIEERKQLKNKSYNLKIFRRLSSND